MIDPASLAFDIDGVVADTMKLFIDLAREEYGIDTLSYGGITSYALEDCLDMDREVMGEILTRIQDGDYEIPLLPMEGAGELLGILGERHGPVLFVTARPYPGPIRDWMVDNTELADASVELVTTGGFDAKAEVLLEKGIRFFVEDRLETCFLLKDRGITPIVYRQPWNREPHPFVEVAGWSDLKRLTGL